MKRWRNCAVVLLVCCVGNAAFAASSERVTAIREDGSLQLEHTEKASFANLRFPEATLAQRWLTNHLLQQELTFEAGDTDRYGRTRITTDVEEAMLREGVAIFYASDATIPASWLAAEATARNKKAGIWSDIDMLITPQNAAQHENEFHVVEGTVTHIYTNKTATYVNFGADWHSDFSITIPAKLRRSMQEKANSIHEGSHVRVRGRLYEENGPMVMLNHADNMEIY